MPDSHLPLTFERAFKPDSVVLGSAAVSYNGFNFPPALRASAEITPVMDDGGRATKYLKLDLKVSCFLFHGLNLGTTGTPASPDHATDVYSTGFSIPANLPAANANGINDATFTTDREMDYLRSRLTEPCQHLQFTSQGVGTINVNDHDQSQNPIAATLDVANGPKPKITTWRPLGNKCCFIVWEVSTCFSPCADDGRHFAQFPFTVEYGISRSGLTTRTISGEVELALTRVPDPSTAHAGESGDFWLSDTQQIVYTYFPMLPGFHRDQKFLVTDDRKHYKFTLTDSEIDSDEAFGEGCVDEEVMLETSNKVPMVFCMWTVTLAGSIELAAGFPKRYALAEISRLFHRYYTVCAFQGDFIARTSSGGSVEGGTTDEDEGAGDTGLAKFTNGSFPILEQLHFTDHLFSRKIDFSISWSLYTTLQTLFTATGMFVPARNYLSDGTTSDIPLANPEGAQRNAWGLWKTSLGYFQDTGGFQMMGFSKSDDVIISLCQDATANPQEPQMMNVTTDSFLDTSYERTPDQRAHGNSWYAFEPRFAIERDEHSHYHAPLRDYRRDREMAKPPAVARESEDYSPNSEANEEADNDSLGRLEIKSRREPSYLLHFTGYAIRLNLPVPEPNVEYYGTDTNGDPIPVTRVGRSLLRPQLIGTGTDFTTGKSYKIYGLMWSKTYALPSAPLSSKIVTDAHKDIYTMG